MKRKIEEKPLYAGGSRAAICHWDTSITFNRKDQAVEFIKLLMKDTINYNFEYEQIMTETSYIWKVHIYDMPWGFNLTRVGKFLANVDYCVE